MLIKVSREKVEGNYFDNLYECENKNLIEYIKHKTKEEKRNIEEIKKWQKKGKYPKVSKAAKKISLVFILAVILLPVPVLAAGEPGIVSGTVNLLNAATSWLLGLIPVGCATMMGWHAFLKQLNEGDPAEAAVHNRAMRNILIGGIIGMSVTGIVKAVLSFYGG